MLPGRPLLSLALPLLILTGSPARAGEGAQISNRKIGAVQVKAPPKVDGDLSDPAWQEAAKAETFTDSFTGSPEIDQTEAWICYDAASIYVAFRCRDREPQAIVGREIRRDAEFQGEDTVSLFLDPFRTRRGDEINRFTTNPLGTPSSYIAGGRANKAEWKGEWEAAARRVEEGWVAEMRIPWHILAVQTGTRTIGINFTRRQERTKIQSQWSNLGPEFQSERNGDWLEVQVPKSAFRRQLSLLPYTTSRWNLGPGRGYDLGIGRGKALNAGLDARMQLTPQLMAVGTLNPDFSTVERAVEGIDFTRGERFVPDTRPFFLEGGDYFDVTRTSGNGWGTAFFSGRIPGFDAGGKVYGRQGARETLGFLGTYDTRRHRGDVVGRWMHDVGPASFVGGYLVQRALPGDSNTVLGLNESIRKGAWTWRSDLSTTFGTDSGGSAANTGIRWEQGPLRANLAYTYIQPDFRAANGFVNFTDFQGPDLDIRYSPEWRQGPIREMSLGFEAVNHRRTDGRFFRRMYELDAWIETRNDWGLMAGWEGGKFLKQTDSEFTLGAFRNLSNRYNRMGLRYSFGIRADEPITYVSPSISKRLFGKWDFNLSSGILKHGERHTLHALSFNREFDPYRALGGRILLRDNLLQYFVSYRVSGGRGMETYFLLGDPGGGARRTRTRFMTKFVFPFSL